ERGGEAVPRVHRRVVQRFGHEAPLDGDVSCAVPGVQSFVAAPADRAMIDDHVLAVVDAQAAAHDTGFVAAAKTQIADDAIVGGHSKRLSAEADSVAGGGLA